MSRVIPLAGATIIFHIWFRNRLATLLQSKPQPSEKSSLLNLGLQRSVVVVARAIFRTLIVIISALGIGQ